MGKASGVSRGDRNRNARLEKLREYVPVDHAIVAIDLADVKQMVVVTDHDSKVLARRTFQCKAWDLGRALDWAADRAAAKGFAGVSVSCEPTGHRWRVLGQLASERSLRFVCVQPIQTAYARRSEDLTVDKTDEKDAVLIARLTAQLRCYVPEPADESTATWSRLRHLGARRHKLLTDTVGQVQEVRDLLECVWPAALTTAAQPFKSRTWAAAMTVIVDRDGGDLDRTRRWGGTGSNAWCAERSPDAAGRNPRSGSPATSSPRSPTPPGWSPTVAAPSSGSRWCWPTGRSTGPG